MKDQWVKNGKLLMLKICHSAASIPLFNCDRTLISSHATLLQIEMRWLLGGGVLSSIVKPAAQKHVGVWKTICVLTQNQMQNRK